jgi:hypothetical protein
MEKWVLSVASHYPNRERRKSSLQSPVGIWQSKRSLDHNIILAVMWACNYIVCEDGRPKRYGISIHIWVNVLHISPTQLFDVLWVRITPAQAAQAAAIMPVGSPTID